jgi:SAM-dependent methyltransferase
MKTIKGFLLRQTINSSQIYLERFLEQASASIPLGALVLDAGAGDCRYQPLFAQARYESADFCQAEPGFAYAEVTYVCDLASIPVEDCRFDLVVCTQVLEHVPEPKAVLQELFRVLKPGARLWLTTPLFYAEHMAPYDYFRYTRFGLDHLLRSVGFHIERVEPLEGYYGTLSYQLESGARNLPASPRLYGGGLTGVATASLALLLKPLFFALSLFFARLDLRYKYSAELCKNYAVVARKRGDADTGVSSA